MTATVDLDEAVTQLSQLLERAHAGEEIVIARRGEPWARLVPLTVLPLEYKACSWGVSTRPSSSRCPDELDG
jgi:prevent-host-death family protein